ncbi:MAG: NAD(P)/FAD-dependent oxidoreductase [Ignavibacteriaceae bacterium]|nr:NAD(P)/FAD-dependent oxidoreductase [Ignavibacteriaceae bacterium]
MIIKKFDIAIIGGGPAGSSAALLLSKRGYSVCLIEKKIFPREVLCGEFISKEVIEYLKENLLYEGFLKLGPNLITSFRFSSENGKDITSSFEFDAYGIKRSILDNFLLTKAIESGAEIVQPAEVNALSRKGDDYLINLKAGQGDGITLNSKFIIAAYGKQNILDKVLGRGFYRRKSNLNGVKFHIEKSHFNNFNPEEIQIYTGDGIYCGLNAVDDKTITLCYLEKRDRTQSSSRELLLRLSRQNKKFCTLLREDFFEYLDKAPIYGTGNIYFGKRDIADEGIFYIGDAAGVIAPLAGDGIGMAIQSARLISDILTKNNLVKEKSVYDYKREWNKMFLRRIYIAGLIQKSILNNILRNPGIKMVSYIPGVLPSLIKYTRG